MCLRIGDYVPPLGVGGSSLDELDELAPGVKGYALLNGRTGAVHIPVILAERPGAGDVGRFLDSLHPRCCVPTVTSDRLRAMLERRGWWMDHEWDGQSGEDAEIFRHPAWGLV